jgi:Uma2 family endonuclease
MATTTSGLITFAELERIPESDGRYELHHGELVRLPPPKHKHYALQLRLQDLMKAAARDAGTVGVEFGFRALIEHEYRVADVAFVSRDRWNAISPEGYLAGAPEIVVEILSPSNTAAGMLDKEQLCLENGSIEFWVVDPVRNQVKVTTAGGRTATYKSGQEIPLFFGGAIAVDDIFRN